ncbi:MAG: AMP-binding protein [Gemmatales bacterium]|nr:AMP-binding protein [Gemmatales bacterium]
MASYEEIWRAWNPWQFIPERYNLGVHLTRGQVERGLGDKRALLWENAQGDTAQYTYAELDALSNRLASALARLGVRRGDRVLLRLPNIPEFYIAALAIAKLGGVFIPTSTQFRRDEIAYRLRDTEAVAAITTTHLLPALEEAANDCPSLRHIIVSAYPDRSQTVPEHYGDFWRLVAAGDENFVPADTRHDDLAFIAYTSGTTGDPKGVVHLHRYPLAYESLVRYWHDYQPDDVVACPSELGWLLPVASTFLYALVHGLTVVLYDPLGGKFDAERWLGLFEKYRITNFTAPPTVYRMLLLAAPQAPQYALSCWRHAVSAGEPLAPDTLQGMERFYGVTPLDGLGMSECMVYCFNMVGQKIKRGSCGRPGPGTVIELMDEQLRPVPPDTPGVLCVRRDTHPGMMKEYWNKPQQTAEVFRGEWYWSGDVLIRDGDGYYWFQGRADDVIKASGYRISPFEVESALLTHPAVHEAAAVESPDPIRGNVVKAFLVLRPGFVPSPQLADEIQQHVKGRIAPFKCPRKIEFVEALPKTTSGKIRRKELRQREFAASGQS